MVIVKIAGGLGNQLFQYSLGRHLALKNNTELKFDISSFNRDNLRSFSLHHFNLALNIANKNEIPFSRRDTNANKYKALAFDLIFSKVKVKKEKHFQFDPYVLDYSDNVYLEGYWQSEKYFTSIIDTIRKDLVFKNDLIKVRKQISILIKNSNSVFVHIRRGDYINNPINNNIYSHCSKEYYQKAIDIILMHVIDPTFFVFSDDISWVRLNIRFPNRHYFVEGNEPWEDLRLMTLCKHSIIANSTFSWWGSYLGDHQEKIVIAPKKWFTDMVDKDSKDLLPKKWIKL